MSHRTCATAMTIAAVATLAVGVAGPAASASPITDFINSIGTGSAAPGAGAAATTEIRFTAGSSKTFQGYVVSRGSSAEDSCFTIQDRYYSKPVTTGFVVDSFTNNTWTVDVDTAKPGCTAPLQTFVSFSNSSYGTPALRIDFNRYIDVSCAGQSGSGGSACEKSYGPRPGGFDFRIQ